MVEKGSRFSKELRKLASVYVGSLRSLVTKMSN